MVIHQSNRESKKVLPIVPYLRDIGVFSDKIPENSALLILCERSDILGHNPLLPDSYLFKVPLWVYKNGETFRVFNYMEYAKSKPVAFVSMVERCLIPRNLAGSLSASFATTSPFLAIRTNPRRF